ncbi:heterokaryon incompatibility protein-domain-containing protein [Phyllosticta capitalensis]
MHPPRLNSFNRRTSNGDRDLELGPLDQAADGSSEALLRPDSNIRCDEQTPSREPSPNHGESPSNGQTSDQASNPAEPAVSPAKPPQPHPAELYASLPVNQNRTIRVLELEAAPKRNLFTRNYYVPLKGYLRVVSLADSPHFTALSYVWGPFSPDQWYIKIWLNGDHELQLTPNCFWALIALRKKFGAITIWIDAICINQKDKEEKRTQLPLMGEIYSWAHCTYVWLGEGSEKSDRAMSRLVEKSTYSLVDAVMWSAGSKRAKLRLAWGIAIRIVLSALLWPYVAIFAFSRDVYRNLRIWWLWKSFRNFPQIYDSEDENDLFSQDWFQRVWTFQEFVLPTNLIFVYGNRAISGSRLMGGIEESFAQNVDKFRYLTSVWMNVNRPTRWNNNKPTRKELPEGKNARVYQEKIFDQVLGKKVVRAPLSILYVVIFGISLSALVTSLFYAVLSPGKSYLNKDISPGQMGFTGVLTLLSVIVSLLPFVVTVFRLGLSGSKYKIARHIHLGVALPNDKRDPETIYLSAIVEAIRKRASTQAKDRSFAVHGILGRLGVQLQDSADKTVLGDIYQDLLTDLIRWKAKMVNLIIDAESRNATSGWTPVASVQWNLLKVSGAIQDAVVLSCGEFAVPSNGTQEKGSNEENAGAANCGKTSDQSDSDENHASSSMQTNAPKNGTEVENDFDNENALWDTLFRLSSWICHARCNGTRLYKSLPKAVHEALCGTIASPEEWDEMRSFDATYRVLSSAGSHVPNHSSPPDDQQLSAFRISVETNAEGPTAVSFMEGYIKRFLPKERTVFNTGNGYVGAGPAAISEGDRIALIGGVGVPMVLRENDSDLEGNKRYTVVGPAFIPGYMCGEIGESEVKLETITLI